MNIFNEIIEAKLWKKEISLSRNEFLLKKGSKDDAVFFVVEGSLKIFIMDNDEEQIIRFGYKDSIITALDTFISCNETQFYIQAIKKTTVKVISKKALIQLIHSEQSYQQEWQNILLNMIQQQLEREVDILTTSPMERYQRVKARTPQLFQEIPHKYIASYLRMTPETLSRIKKS